MQNRIFVLWLSIIWGLILYVAWSHPLVWVSFGGLILLYRHLWSFIVLGSLVGLLRMGIGDCLVRKSLPLGLHVYEIQMTKSAKFSNTADLLSIDLERFDASFQIKVFGKYRYGEILRGVGEVHWGENSRSLQSGWVLKWAEAPQSLGVYLSIRDRVRQWVRQILNTDLEPLGSIRRALVIGDGGGLSLQTWRDLNFLGLSHALVISGSHLTAIMAAVGFVLGWLLSLLGLRLIWLKIPALMALSAFLYICNQEVSLLRAFWGYVLLLVVAEFIPAIHRYSSSDRLALIGILILLGSPLEILRPTYALSFGATWALVNSLEKGFFASCLSVFFVVNPLGMLYGFQTHWASPLLNFLFLGVFTMILCPLSLFSMAWGRLEPFANGALQFYFKFLHGLARILDGERVESGSGLLLGGIGILFVLAIHALSELRSSQRLSLLISLQFLLIAMRHLL